jgi:cytochrome c-type biogenesis protein
MMVVGLILYLLQQSFGVILPVLLPAIYGLVLVMGVLMVNGRNPFASLSTLQTPALSNPYVGAYVYGLLLGPMTLPCAGPIVVSAFLLGAGSFSGVASGLAYFLAFGLGFGWPLVLLPLVAAPAQKQFTRWMTQHYSLLTRLSGVLLIGIAIWGFVNDLLPNL